MVAKDDRARALRCTRRSAGFVLAALALLLACAPAHDLPHEGSAARPTAVPPATAVGRGPTSVVAAAAPTSPPLAPARVAYSSLSPAFLPHFAAEALGLYRQYGLESVSLQANPSVSIPALISGEMDYVLSIGSVSRAAAKGLPVRVLAVHAPKPHFFLIARPALQQGSDLRDKVIGVGSFGGNVHETARLYVSYFGLDPGRDVQFLSLGDEPVLMEALRLGRVDAIPVHPPLPALAQREGFRVLATPDDLRVEFPFTGTGTSVEKIATQRDQVKRALKAQLAALEAIRSEREAMVRLMVERFAMEPDIAALTYDQIRGTWTADGAVAREGIETIQRLDVETGALEAAVPYEQIVDLSVLEEARQELRASR